MKTRKLNIDRLLSLARPGPSLWELDNIIWNDRNSNPDTLLAFMKRIQELEAIDDRNPADQKELENLIDLANEMDEDECLEVLENDDEVAQQNFIESLARKSAIEVLCNERVSEETMYMTCKLSPSDFILTAKRTQDLINSIHELVIQGETLSSDVAGA